MRAKPVFAVQPFDDPGDALINCLLRGAFGMKGSSARRIASIPRNTGFQIERVSLLCQFLT